MWTAVSTLGRGTRLTTERDHLRYFWNFPGEQILRMVSSLVGLTPRLSSAAATIAEADCRFPLALVAGLRNRRYPYRPQIAVTVCRISRFCGRNEPVERPCSSLASSACLTAGSQWLRAASMNGTR